MRVATGKLRWRKRARFVIQWADENGMKKLLQTLPNGLILFGGIAVVAVLLSPFLMELFGNKPRTGVTLKEDTENLPDLSGTVTNHRRNERPLQVLPEAQLLNRYAGIALNDPSAQLAKRFQLTLISRENTIPQIYEARNQQGLEYLQAKFYGDKLKEFVVVYPPQQTMPDDLANELFAAFGEVPAWLRNRDEDSAHIGAVTADLIEEFLTYPHARPLAWSDGENRVDATIYSRIGSDDQTRCVLAVQVSAAKWLKDQETRQELGVTVALPEKPETGSSTTEPSSSPPPPTP